MKIIGLHAYKQVGKDTLSEMICANWGFVSVAFAEPLYRGIKAMFPHITVEYFQDRNKIIPFLGKSVNELLQSLGTEWGRLQVKEAVWIEEAYREGKTRLLGADAAGIVFRDVRYDNEAAFVVEELGGVVIALESEKGTRLNGHSSENGISEKYITYRLPNNSSKDALWRGFKELGI